MMLRGGNGKGGEEGVQEKVGSVWDSMYTYVLYVCIDVIYLSLRTFEHETLHLDLKESIKEALRKRQESKGRVSVGCNYLANKRVRVAKTTT